MHLWNVLIMKRRTKRDSAEKPSKNRPNDGGTYNEKSDALEPERPGGSAVITTSNRGGIVDGQKS